jgi:tRNA (guanine-N7-)-methyltransferase
MKNPRKRLSSTYFLQRYRQFMQDGGLIHLKTDSNFLFTYTTYMVDRNHLPVELKTDDLYKQEDQAYAEAASIQTYYESMWLARGLNIKYMKFQLPHEGTLEEPDIEIELDDYRSYHRSKRSSLETAK